LQKPAAPLLSSLLLVTETKAKVEISSQEKNYLNLPDWPLSAAVGVGSTHT
jgi:hypothetical protein